MTEPGAALGPLDQLDDPGLRARVAGRIASRNEADSEWDPRPLPRIEPLSELALRLHRDLYPAGAGGECGSRLDPPAGDREGAWPLHGERHQRRASPRVANQLPDLHLVRRREEHQAELREGAVVDPVPRRHPVDVIEDALDEPPTGIGWVVADELTVAGLVRQEGRPGIGDPDDQAAARKVERRLCGEGHLVVALDIVTPWVVWRLAVVDDGREGLSVLIAAVDGSPGKGDVHLSVVVVGGPRVEGEGVSHLELERRDVAVYPARVWAPIVTGIGGLVEEPAVLGARLRGSDRHRLRRRGGSDGRHREQRDSERQDRPGDLPSLPHARGRLAPSAYDVKRSSDLEHDR